MTVLLDGGGTKSHVPYAFKALNSSYIAIYHSTLLEAHLKVLGSCTSVISAKKEKPTKDWSNTWLSENVSIVAMMIAQVVMPES